MEDERLANEGRQSPDRSRLRPELRRMLEAVDASPASGRDPFTERAKASLSVPDLWGPIDDVAAILRIRRETLDRAYIEKWTRELRIEDQWVKARDAAEM